MRIVYLLMIMLLCSFFAEARNKYALIIGINQYKVEKYKHVVSMLDGCVNDALSMQALLTTRFQFNANNIDLLLDSVATKRSILSAFEKLVRKAGEDDIVFVYYAGHGVSFMNSMAQKKQKTTQGIVSYDVGAPYNSIILDFELSQYYNRIIDKGAFVTAVFDCCHSGDMPMNAGMYKSYKYKLRARSIDDDDFTTAPSKDYAIQQKAARFTRDIPSLTEDLETANTVALPVKKRAGAYLFLSAAQSDQASLETIDANGNVHGAFTKALLSVLENNEANISAADLFTKIKQQLRVSFHPASDHFMFDPIPGMITDSLRRLKNLVASDATEVDDSIQVAIVEIKNSQVKLNAGLLAGLHFGNKLYCNRQKNIIVQIDTTPANAYAWGTIIQGSAKELRTTDRLVLFDKSRTIQPVMKIYKPGKTFSLLECRYLILQLQPLLRSTSYWPYEAWGDPPYSVLFDNGESLLAAYGKKFAPTSIASILKIGKRDSLQASFCLYLPVPTEYYTKLESKFNNDPNFTFTSNEQEANFNLYVSYMSDGRPIVTLTNTIIGKRMEYLEQIEAGKEFYSRSHLPDQKYTVIANQFDASRTVFETEKIYQMIKLVGREMQWLEY